MKKKENGFYMAAILEVVYGPDFDMINEKSMVYVNDDYISSNKPIKLLEESIASCIGLGILKYIDLEKIKNPFGRIIINIAEEEIHIHIDISEDLLNKFINICKECYITNHLIFRSKIINRNETIELWKLK